MKIIIDTSALLLPGESKVDVFDQLRMLGYDELFTTGRVLAELDAFSKKRDRRGRAALLAWELIKKNEAKIIETAEKDADEQIFSLAVKDGYHVCTLDKKLTARLRKEKVKVVSLRQKKILEDAA